MLKLEVGKFYMRANGEVIEIKRNKKKGMFEDNSYAIYYENGQICRNRTTKCDLIAEIPKELHQHLIKEVMNYWQDEDFRKTVNNVYGVGK